MEDKIKTEKLPLENIADEKLDRIYTYWQSKRGEHRWPARADISPADFPWLLGKIGILETEGEPPNFRYRLDGSAIAETHAQDMTGQTVDKVKPAIYADMLREHFTEALESGEASLYRIELQLNNKSASYLRLVMPLTAGGDSIKFIMTASALPENFKDIAEEFKDIDARPDTL